MQQIKKRKTGFTLVELSISIVFIAILSLAVVLVIMDTVSAYRRGLTLNQINTTGSDLVDDIMSAVQGSPAQSLKNDCALYIKNNMGTCEDEGGLSFTSFTRYGYVTVKNEGTNASYYGNTVPLWGAFCTGNYSYIWNSGYYFVDDYQTNIVAATLNNYDSGDKPFKLLKIKDEGRAICRSVFTRNGDGYTYPRSYNGIRNSVFSVDYDASNPEMAPEDLIAKESNLALYDLEIGTPSMGANDRSMLYPVSFVLGTIQGGVDVTVAGDNCAPPEAEGEGSGTNKGYRAKFENSDYCSINKFNFAAQAIGG